MLKLLQLTVVLHAVGYLLQFIAFFLFAKMLGAENQGVLTVKSHPPNLFFVFTRAGELWTLILPSP